MITTKIKIFFFMLGLLIIALATSLWFAQKKESVITSLENNRFELYILINTQKKNSTDFSNLVNKYIFLQDDDYLESMLHFVQLSSHSNLIQERNIALSESNFFFKPIEKSKVEHMKGFLKEIGLSNKMFKKIFRLNEYEEEILKLEIQAINFYNGYEKDAQGIYSQKVDDGKTKAESILHSFKYQILKDGLNRSVDEVLDSTDLLMQEYINIQNKKQAKYYYIAFMMLITLAILIIIGIIYSHNYLIRSLQLLMSWTKEVEKGTYIFHNHNAKEDEISHLMNSFSSMAQTIKNNIYKLEQLSLTDTLTKLYNRRALNKILDDEHHKFIRYKTACAIVIIDIDHFKNVNDTYGHDVGDTVLKDFARILNHNVRKTDTVGRWGGEEFLIICPNTSKKNARILANTLRNKIETFPFTVIGNKTASFGLAEFCEKQTLEETLVQADEALYEAKAAGRNCVM